EPGEGHRQRLAAQPPAMAQRTLGAHHVTRYALLDRRALRGRKRREHEALRAGEIPEIARLLFPLERAARLGRRIARVDRDHGLFFREENPVAILFWKIPPGSIDVVAQRDEHVAQVLA